MKEKTAELKEKIEKDYKDMIAVINGTSLPLFVEDTIEDMYILIKNLISENKELKEENLELLTRLRADGMIERDKYWKNKIIEKLLKPI